MLSKKKDIQTSSKNSEKFDPEILSEFIEIPKAFQESISECKSREVLSEKFPSLCLIGVTGSGKSSTANSIAGTTDFMTSTGVQSTTEKVKGIVTTWFGQENEEPIIVVDSPGIGDSKGRDTEHIANMVDCFKKLGYINNFLIVISSEEIRFNEQLQQTLKLFQSMFGKEFLNNAMICFTRFYSDSRTEKERKTNRRPSSEKLIKEYSELFRTHYGYSLKESQFVFIDNGIQNDGSAEAKEQQNFEKALEKIQEFTFNSKPFFCQDIKEVMKEKEQLQEQIKQILKEQEDQKTEIIEQYQKKIDDAVQFEKNKIVQLENEYQNKIREIRQEFEQYHSQRQYSSQQPSYYPGTSIFVDYPPKRIDSPKVVPDEPSSKHLKKNGEPDYRYTENRTSGFNMDETIDKRFGPHPKRSVIQSSNDSQLNNTGYSSASHFKKDGTLDMRFKENKTLGYNMNSSTNQSYYPSTGSSVIQSQNASKLNNTSYSTLGPMKKDGTPDMRYKANKLW